jgi:ankyrin repeat protein
MPELIKPVELDSADLDWTGQYRRCDIWEILSAARSGDVERVKQLLSQQPSLVNAEYWYMPPIHFAVREGQLAVVKVLVEAGPDLTHRVMLYGNDTLITMAREREHQATVAYLESVMKDRFQSSGADHEIHRAVSAGNLDAVKSLVEKEPALVRRGDHLGRQPLHRAVETGRLDLVAYLLDHGADVDAPGFSSDDRLGGNGFRPIDLALWHQPYWRQRNDYKLVGYLLARGAKYTITIAAALGDLHRVKECLTQYGSLANDAEACGKRPLSAAAERGYTEVVRVLLEHGADPVLPEGKNCPKGYALWAASHFGYRDLAELLLKHGADPNGYVDSSGNPTESAKDDAMRALMYRHGGKVGLWGYVWYGNMDAVAAALEANPHVFEQQSDTTPFTAVVKAGHRDMLHMLLAKGVRVPDTLTHCQTYLWHAPDLTRILLEHGMNPNLPNWQRITPLHHIAREGNVEKAKLFLEFGADIHAIDEEYRSTPLGWAARHGCVAMVNYLLQQGADRDLPEEPGWAKPLAWARNRGHEEIVHRLQEGRGT